MSERQHSLQLTFLSEAWDRLFQLKQKLEARSYSEVIYKALRLYDWFRQQEEGYQLQLVKGDLVKEVDLKL